MASLDRMMFRLPTAIARDPAVDAWLSARPGELGDIARTWFAKMRECGDDVCELMHDGQATACVGDAPFGYVAVYTAHVNVGFFHGATLPDPAGLLEGSGKFMRHVKLKPGTVANAAALSALVDAAYSDIRRKLARQFEARGARSS